MVGSLRVMNCVLVMVLGSFKIAKAEEDLRLQGEPEAVALIELMLERFGGAAVWANAKGLYVEYDGWRTLPNNEPMVERAWRDFVNQIQRSEFEAQTTYNVRYRSATEGWISRMGEITEIGQEELDTFQERYPYGFYTSFHTFAKADQNIRLSMIGPNRVQVSLADGTVKNWWEIDSTGALIKWAVTASDGRVFEYVYGPMRRFGNINYPAWGAATDGFWRWTYTKVDVSLGRITIPTEKP